MGEGLRFVGCDVHELVRRTAGRAPVARHVGVAVAAQRSIEFAEPGGERPGGKLVDAVRHHANATASEDDDDAGGDQGGHRGEQAAEQRRSSLERSRGSPSVMA